MAGLAVLLPLHHNVLHGAAQGGLNGHGAVVGHVEQPATGPWTPLSWPRRASPITSFTALE